MPPAEAALVAKVREQVKCLRDRQDAYDQLRVYVSGITSRGEEG
jgi:hypothetical protein